MALPPEARRRRLDGDLLVEHGIRQVSQNSRMRCELRAPLNTGSRAHRPTSRSAAWASAQPTIPWVGWAAPTCHVMGWSRARWPTTKATGRDQV